jgi:hypothetical protein
MVEGKAIWFIDEEGSRRGNLKWLWLLENEKEKKK